MMHEIWVIDADGNGRRAATHFTLEEAQRVVDYAQRTGRTTQYEIRESPDEMRSALDAAQNIAGIPL